MTDSGRPVRDEQVVWRDIAGEVVIAERDNRTIRVLNRTASVIWTLSDGTRTKEDIAAEICNRFEVACEEAKLDVSEFCRQLLASGLMTMTGTSEEV